ncbi:MAG: hypothetical protein R2741_03140 [Methanolobus sp.]
MGYYAVAFSPDSKMYAAPRIIFSEDGRNGQYAIDICSVENNTLLHREMTPYYKENTKSTPMKWDRSIVYEVYWSEDGSCIIYDVLGANIDGGTYPTYIVTTKLNLDYNELRKLNGYEGSDNYTGETTTDDRTPVESSSMPAPGIGITGSLIALAIGRRIAGK